jgi:hypothetical protein
VSTTLASAADARYGYWLLNMLGSVKANSDVFDRVVVYDLGLSPFQRRLASGIRCVEFRSIPEFVPHWREGFTWKPWIWTHVEGERIVWLDAGLSVLRPLTGALAQIDDHDYFAVSQGHPVGDVIPSDYYEIYDLPRALADRDCIAAGIHGFRRGSAFYERVIVPTYEDCVAGRSTGFSPGDDRLNTGLGREASPTVRDCLRFRWDQSVFNLRFYSAYPEPALADLDEYGGYRSPHDHPRQVIWHHRRRGDYRFLVFVPYRPRTWLVGKAWGAWTTASWWKRTHSWLFRPATYARKLRRLGLSR